MLSLLGMSLAWKIAFLMQSRYLKQMYAKPRDGKDNTKINIDGLLVEDLRQDQS